MPPATEEVERSYNILVFGAERLGLPVPPKPVQKRNFTLSFEKYGTPRRFQEFDGVILFQGLFERFENKSNYMSSYLAHRCDTDELDKRKKEASLLSGQGGFLCFLLTEAFIDHDDGRDFSATDLAKFHLNHSNFYRENFSKRVTHVSPMIDEFKRFLDMFGAASSHFKIYNNALNYRVLAQVSGHPVGLIVEGVDYFVPSLVPDARPEVVAEFFELLADGLTSIHNKLHQALPAWIGTYRFEEEASIDLETDKLKNQLSRLDQRRGELEKYKAALFYTGGQLVSVVGQVLSASLGVTIDSTDDLREDLKLLDDKKVPIAVCEVKGINRGIKRENINQTDSHRERSGFSEDFPAILIANIGIKNARTIEEKDQEIAAEQVRHAVQMRVLLLRTLDLLGVLRLVLSGKLSADTARELLLRNVGWLRVQADEIKILSGK
jgi:hypothetical protein